VAENGDLSDLLIIAIPGVQRFITESRTTSDLASASEIVAELARVAAQTCAGAARVVLPASAATLDTEETGEAGKSGERAGARAGAYEGDAVSAVPNRVVVQAPAGTGEVVARAAADAVRAKWQSMLRVVYPRETPSTPGVPEVNWVCVPATCGDYALQWDRAQRALVARRRVRDFTPVLDADGRQLCSLSPRWPAQQPPRDARTHHREERLAAANWVKRQWRYGGDAHSPGFPSTYSIASGPFRRAVLDRIDAGDAMVIDAVEALWAVVRRLPKSRETPVPGLNGHRTEAGPWLAASGGPWVYASRWNALTLQREYRQSETEARRLAEQGSAAVGALVKAMEGCAHLALYLAVIVQDLDSMGAFLGGDRANGRRHVIDVAPDAHADVARNLAGVARRQIEALRGEMSVPVYAGGDDLLAFAPASRALAAAQAVHGHVPEDLPTASTAVVFFHPYTSLRQAVGTAQELLEEAKSRVPGKHGLAVGYLRRSGTREESIQPWRPDSGKPTASDLFASLDGDHTFRLSPRLVSDLERDTAELADLYDADPEIYRKEIRRLVDRHLGGPGGDERTDQVNAVSTALIELGVRERSQESAWERSASAPITASATISAAIRPVPVARVAVFLRQAAWGAQQGADEQLRNDIFGLAGSDPRTARRGSVRFLDALPVGNPLKIAVDVLTPHQQPYYGSDGATPPAEHHNPVPTEFLVVSGGSFAIDLVGAAKAVEQAATWCESALDELGVGAKTAAGYGYLRIKERT
jgi:CRISPR-associated protein Cmr2